MMILDGLVPNQILGTIKAKIKIQTAAQRIRNEDAARHGKIVSGILLGVWVYHLLVLIFSLCQKSEKSFFEFKRLDSLFYLGFLVKFTLIEGEFSPGIIYMLNNLFNLDSFSFMNVKDELEGLREGIPLRFSQYQVPILTINSVLVQMILVLISAVLLLTSRVFLKGRGQRKRMKANFERISSFIIILTFPNLFFYGLFSLTNKLASFWNLISLPILLFSVIMTGSVFFENWKARAPKNKREIIRKVCCFKKKALTISFLEIVSQPIKFTIFNLLLILNLKFFGGALIQIVLFHSGTLLTSLVFNCCIYRQGCLTPILSLLKDFTLLFMIAVLGMSNQFSEVLTDDLHWEFTSMLIYVIYAFLVVGVLVPEVQDLVAYKSLGEVKKQNQIKPISKKEGKKGIVGQIKANIQAAPVGGDSRQQQSSEFRIVRKESEWGEGKANEAEEIKVNKIEEVDNVSRSSEKKSNQEGENRSQPDSWRFVFESPGKRVTKKKAEKNEEDKIRTMDRRGNKSEEEKRIKDLLSRPMKKFVLPPVKMSDEMALQLKEGSVAVEDIGSAVEDK